MKAACKCDSDREVFGSLPVLNGMLKCRCFPAFPVQAMYNQKNFIGKRSFSFDPCMTPWLNFLDHWDSDAESEVNIDRPGPVGAKVTKPWPRP